MFPLKFDDCLSESFSQSLRCRVSMMLIVNHSQRGQSFSTFSTIERIYVGRKYGDIPRGVFIVRGENVVLLGEIDEKRYLYLILEVSLYSSFSSSRTFDTFPKI